MFKRTLFICLAGFMSLALVSSALAGLTQEERLGKLLYFDRNLSKNRNQSCASCHDPGAGFTDPLNLRLPKLYPVSVGSDVALNGGRNAPPAAYAKFSPSFYYDTATGLYTGGQFWDGRAPALKDQAKGPFLNPVEMAMADEAAVIAALKDPANSNSDDYQALFKKVYGIKLSAIDTTMGRTAAVLNAYDMLAQAIGEFEKTDTFASFSSKFDRVMAGKAAFTDAEQRGWEVFSGQGNCTACHPAAGTTVNADNLFTDFTYDNLGIPKSTNTLIAGSPDDLGLGAGDNTLVPAADLPLLAGKFKVSSLRNIAMTAPYGHNGYFETLEEIVHFYNTRNDGTWPEAEVPGTVNITELGSLGLSADQEADLVAFLKTLTDGDR
jgi:cytochrome c peroxidase